MEEVDNYFASEKLTCLYCKKKYHSLHAHLWQCHRVHAETYKAEFGIPWNRGLISQTVREKLSKQIASQRAAGVIPQSPSKEHLKKLRTAVKNRRPTQAAVRDSMSKHALRTHGRSERWNEKDMQEYLDRIASGRTVTEVGKDKDMPSREVFDKHLRENPKFKERYEEVWEAVPFAVQARAQRLGDRFNYRVVALRDEGKTWPEIANLLDVNESTARTKWHRLKHDGLLEKYRK